MKAVQNESHTTTSCSKSMCAPDLNIFRSSSFMMIVHITVTILVAVVVIALVCLIYLCGKKGEESKKLNVGQRQKRERSDMVETGLPVGCPDLASSRVNRLHQQNFGVENELREEHIYAEVDKSEMPTTEL
jgi:hypothetical protein